MKTTQISIAVSLLIYYSLQGVNFVNALECYVCTNQTGNGEKCLNNYKVCETYEDVCGTEISWGSIPYFSQGAKKQYYVTKRCMTKQQCLAKRKRLMPYCTHIWYEDWSCQECCLGDRCNYFVISSSHKLFSSKLVLQSIIFAFGVYLIHNFK